jgi:hypothetical protein
MGFVALLSREQAACKECYSHKNLHDQVQVCAESCAGAEKSLHLRKGQHWAITSFYLALSITGKLFRPDVIVVYTGFIKRSSSGRDHGRWSGNVIDRGLEFSCVLGEHLRADVSSLPFPAPVVGRDPGEGWNKTEPGIRPLQVPERIHEGSIFQITIHVEQEYRMLKPLHRGVGKDAKKRCNAYTASQ